jgi:hypothetical protein
MSKQIQTFFTLSDEMEFTKLLRQKRPHLVFVDGGRWSTPIPPVSEAIPDCKDHFVFLWDREIIAELPYFLRDDGKCDGPRSGTVIEFQRSKLLDRLLLAGRLAESIGHADPRIVELMKKFAADVWSILKQMTKQPIAIIDIETGTQREEKITEFRAADDAIKWANSSEKNYLSSYTRNVFFKPRN